MYEGNLENIYGDPDAVYGVASSMFFNWYMRAQTHSWSPAMAMMTMADQGTSSWMNSGMFDLSSEPRIELDNSESYQYQYIFEHTPNLPEAAAKEGLTELDYMKKYGAFEVEAHTYKKNESIIPEEKLAGSDFDPVSKIYSIINK